jgi:hypothetical protein
MVPRRIDARWWVGVWCCFDVGLSSHVDKLTGSTMASHQQPPFNYRPFEDLMWRSSRNYTTVRSSDVAVAVSGHDGMLEWRQDSSTWVLSDERLSQRFFSRFDTILYTDSIDAELTVQGRHKGPIPARMCCGEANRTLGRSIVLAQYKREHVLGRFFAQFPHRRWYIVTEEDVWWSGNRLLALLSSVDRALSKEAARRGVAVDAVPALVGGGPDGGIDGPFLVLNRVLLAQLAGAEQGASSKTRGLSPCRDALLQCIASYNFQRKHVEMCRFVKRDHKFAKGATATATAAAARGATYNWGHIIAFCTTHFRNHLPEEKDNRVLKFVSMDFLEPTWGLPNFVQNGNSWSSARSLKEGYLTQIHEIYRCCLRCERRVVIAAEDEARYALTQALRALVSWHHATSDDVSFLDAITGPSPAPEMLARAIGMVQSGEGGAAGGCDWGKRAFASSRKANDHLRWNDIYRDLPMSARNNSEITRSAVAINALVLRHAPDTMKKDREVVLKAVRQNGLALQHASARLRGDRVVVMEAVKQDGWALEYASSELRSDREIAMEATRSKAEALKYASTELSGDQEIVAKAVQQSGRALQHASAELQGDRDIVIMAVKQNGLALEHASDELQGDRDVVVKAIEQTEKALAFASAALKSDREVVMITIRRCGQSSDRCNLHHVLANLPPHLRGDKEIVELAVSRDWRVLRLASPTLKADRDIVRAAVRQCSRSSRCNRNALIAGISPELRKDEEEMNILNLNLHI